MDKSVFLKTIALPKKSLRELQFQITDTYLNRVLLQRDHRNVNTRKRYGEEDEEMRPFKYEAITIRVENKRFSVRSSF